MFREFHKMLLQFLKKTFACLEYLVSLRTFIGITSLYSNETKFGSLHSSILWQNYWALSWYSRELYETLIRPLK